GFLEEGAVVIVEHQMLAFVSHDVCDALPVAVVLGDEKSARIESQNHSSSIDKAALIVAASGILPGRDGHVRRIIALAIFHAVGAPYEDRIVGIVQAARIAMATRNLEKLREAVVNSAQDFRARSSACKHTYAARSSGHDRESVSRHLLGIGD